jgi:perosamine synthetase
MSWKSLNTSGNMPTTSGRLAADGGQPVSTGFIPIIQVALDKDEIAEMVTVLRSGKLREGPVCRKFEDRFATFVGARHAVSVSSGTAALHIAYAALLEPGDEVLVPSFTFIATASMVAMVGARPVFCDVDPYTCTLDVQDAQQRITARTRAIAPVHLFGNPCDMDAITTLADEHGLKIIWDAAQSHGARYDGRDVGSFDDVVCYSFYPSKNMTTAEGGMITTNDEALYQKMKLLRSHGQAGKYYHTMLGFNYRLTDIMAVLGLKQLEKLDDWVQRRRANAHYLTEHLADIPRVQTPVEQPRGESSFNLYSIQLDLEQFRCDRDEFVRLLNAENIGATVNYPRSLHQQPAFSEIAGDVHLPVSEDLSQRILSIPVHPRLSQDELDLVVEAVYKVVHAIIK